MALSVSQNFNLGIDRATLNQVSQESLNVQLKKTASTKLLTM